MKTPADSFDFGNEMKMISLSKLFYFMPFTDCSSCISENIWTKLVKQNNNCSIICQCLIFHIYFILKAKQTISFILNNIAQIPSIILLLLQIQNISIFI